MTEYKLPVEMPTLLGAGSEFIPLEDVPKYTKGVIKYDELDQDTTDLGFIFGGISSSAKNIFWVNTGTQSSASNQLFKVRLIKNATATLDHLNAQSRGTLKLLVAPNPTSGNFDVRFQLHAPSDVKITFSAISGGDSEVILLKNQAQGEVVLKKKHTRNLADGVYYIRVETADETAVQKIVLKK
jgi:hypothetical protein